MNLKQHKKEQFHFHANARTAQTGKTALCGLKNFNLYNSKLFTKFTNIMKEVIKTTTGELSRRMILKHCGDYAGRFQDEAFDIFQEAWDIEIAELDDDEWMDIMFDGAGNVYAIDAEGELTCQNADCYVIQLDRADCPEAFNEMEKRNG